jgi:ADP-ribose pyrophosphatase YjhB (NUDIX family)
MASGKREYPERPMIGVGGVIVDDGQVLLVRRGQPPLAGEWSIPGGLLEVGETLEEGLRREMREETGLEVTPAGLLEVLDRILRDEHGRARYHYVLIDYLCRIAPGARERVRAASDAADCRWFSPDDLPGCNLHPDTLRVVRGALDRAGAKAADG